MIGIVIISHGAMGRGLLDAAEMIAGKQEGVESVELKDSDDIEALSGRIAQAASGLTVQDILVLVDLFGGSPGNAALRTILEGKLESAECVSGANLPMLLEVLMARERLGLQELAALALKSGQQGIRDMGAAIRDQQRSS